jgi:enamine deaminase RidA (YjgF/YER057c/UK114 family)
MPQMTPIPPSQLEPENLTKLRELEASLPPAPQPVGSYVPVLRVGNLVFTSGTLPMRNGVLAYTGAVGSYAIPVEIGQEAAKLCALNCLSILKGELGSLDRIVRIVKVTGYVSSARAFFDHPSVLNGASNFLVEVFGERGKHVRAAVGVAALPLDASVEIDMIVEVQ